MEEHYWLRSIEGILIYAYQSEVVGSVPVSSAELSIKATDPLELNSNEKGADGIFYRKRAMRNLESTHLRHTIAAYYRIPFDDDLRVIHEGNISSLAYIIQQERGIYKNKYFIRDVIRDWTYHARPHWHKGQKNLTINGLLNWWSKRTGIPEGTLRNHAISRDPNRRSIKYLLDLWKEQAESQLISVFYDELNETRLGSVVV